MEDTKTMNICEKLVTIQNELKAPKSQYNTFGKYKYRNCEDILEAVKPICLKNRTALTVTDEIVQVGDRYYVKAIATLYDLDSDKHVKNIAYAREEENKKGMDSSQVTGATSSYARKYALNGLFCIDDTKDPDSDEFKNQQDKNNSEKNNDNEQPKDRLVTDKEVLTLRGLLKNSTAEATNKNIAIILKKYNKVKLEELMATEYVDIIHRVEEQKQKSKKSMEGVL